ncbi:MAG: transposase [Halieaceae bacterium]
MKRKRYSEEKIISIFKQREAGRSIADLSSEYGIVENTLCQLLLKFLDPPQRLCQLIICCLARVSSVASLGGRLGWLHMLVLHERAIPELHLPAVQHYRVYAQ